MHCLVNCVVYEFISIKPLLKRKEPQPDENVALCSGGMWAVEVWAGIPTMLRISCVILAMLTPPLICEVEEGE